MTPLQAIRANAQLVLEQLGPISDLGEQFGYNLESLRYVEGFIERFRARTGVTEATIERWVQVFGSFLGECVIHTYGGEWREHKGTWGIFFSEANDRNAAFPFAKVQKQFANGLQGGDSIVSFFQLIPVMFKDLVKKASQP
jgi:hypothetical protein